MTKKDKRSFSLWGDKDRYSRFNGLIIFLCIEINIVSDSFRLKARLCFSSTSDELETKRPYLLKHRQSETWNARVNVWFVPSVSVRSS